MSERNILAHCDVSISLYMVLLLEVCTSVNGGGRSAKWQSVLNSWSTTRDHHLILTPVSERNRVLYRCSSALVCCGVPAACPNRKGSYLINSSCVY